MNDPSFTDETWGLAFDVAELSEGIAHAAAIGLPLDELALDHEHAEEVLYVPKRFTASSDGYLFRICHFPHHKGRYRVAEYLETGEERCRYFEDLETAFSFCRAQRGDDWPVD